jgi:hypothetical protein
MTIDYGTLFSNLNFTLVYFTVEVLLYTIVLYHACRACRSWFKRFEYKINDVADHASTLTGDMVDLHSKLTKHKNVVLSEIVDLDRAMNSNLVRVGDLLKDLNTKIEVLTAKMDAREERNVKDGMEEFMKAMEGCLVDSESDSDPEEDSASDSDTVDDSDSESESDDVDSESTDDEDVSGDLNDAGKNPSSSDST